MSKVRDRNASAWLLPNDGTRTNHQLRADMARFDDGDEVDAVVVGCGAGGGVLTQRLARAGWKVVAFDAGPFWDPDRDWVSDEAGSHRLYWTENRVVGGADPVPLGANNSGRGVGGSMVHFAGYAPRFHPSDFHTRSLDGVGADWPISYDELRPYYEAIEAELPVAGQHWPWGDPHGYPHSPHPVGGDGELFIRGCTRLGIQARVGPVAIANGRFGNRPHCIYRGFCLQGCKVNAKASSLVTHIPDALARGAEAHLSGPGMNRRRHDPSVGSQLLPRVSCAGQTVPVSGSTAMLLGWRCQRQQAEPPWSRRRRVFRGGMGPGDQARLPASIASPAVQTAMASNPRSLAMNCPGNGERNGTP